MKKIKSFTDLIAWQKGHQLVIATYKVTDEFPNKETFALVNQMRRCAVSITSNIAEGFSRQGRKEKIQCFDMDRCWNYSRRYNWRRHLPRRNLRRKLRFPSIY
ncbi:four helix bundle protein [Patescibacteria group bacterium]|nr:four helix bundle protein [Patescibacteria group bacterium]